jgi:hypothetical protein
MRNKMYNEKQNVYLHDVLLGGHQQTLGRVQAIVRTEQLCLDLVLLFQIYHLMINKKNKKCIMRNKKCIMRNKKMYNEKNKMHTWSFSFLTVSAAASTGSCASACRAAANVKQNVKCETKCITRSTKCKM